MHLPEWYRQTDDDTLRRILLTVVALGLIVACIAWVDRHYAFIGAVVMLGIASVSIAISWAVAAWRRAASRAALRDGTPEPEFEDADPHSSWVWDSTAAVMLAGSTTMLVLGAF